MQIPFIPLRLLRVFLRAITPSKAWIPAAALYLIFRGGHIMACSKCGAKIADAV